MRRTLCEIKYHVLLYRSCYVGLTRHIRLEPLPLPEITLVELEWQCVVDNRQSCELSDT